MDQTLEEVDVNYGHRTMKYYMFDNGTVYIYDRDGEIYIISEDGGIPAI